MVSIIVSAYKDRGYLDQAIQSCINQDFKDKEIILSSDGDWSLSEYANRYGIAFCCTEKGNHSTAFNTALQLCSGEWIKECHDDDELLPDCVTNLYNARKGADFIYSNAIDVWPDREEIYRPPENITLSDLLPVITNPINFLTIMFKRKAAIAIGGFDVNLLHSEDYEFYIRMLRAGYRFKYVDKEVVRYRHHMEQLTQIYDENKRQWARNYISKKHKL
jgi:glycosyltransferase involved in cell wall biosynthesis